MQLSDCPLHAPQWRRIAAARRILQGGPRMSEPEDARALASWSRGRERYDKIPWAVSLAGMEGELVYVHKAHCLTGEVVAE